MAPSRGLDSTQMRPPWASTRRLHTTRPRPIPSAPDFASSLWNGSNNFCWFSMLIPRPLVANADYYLVPFLPAKTRTSLPSGGVLDGIFQEIVQDPLEPTGSTTTWGKSAGHVQQDTMRRILTTEFSVVWRADSATSILPSCKALDRSAWCLDSSRRFSRIPASDCR